MSSGLFGELSRTSQALNAHSQGIFTAGRNMANVNNPAYARQRVILGDRGMVQTTLGPQSLGVAALGLENVRDAILDKQVLRETALMKALEAEADAYYKAQLSLGQQIDRQNDASFVDGANNTSSGGGIGAAITDFINAFSSVAANPRSDAEKQILFQKAQTLVSQFRTVDSRLDTLQSELTENVTTEVDEVNSILEVIKDLNRQIGMFEVGNAGSALDLRDKRQAKLEELSKLMDFEVEAVPDSIGQIRIVSRDAADNPVVLLDSARDFNPVSFDGTNILGGGPPAVALSLTSGTMRGRLSARDGAIADLRSSIDRLAGQIVSAVNTTYNPGGVSTDFFLATGTTAATMALDPSLSAKTIRATNTANPGANEVALAIADLGARQFDTGSGDAIDGSFGGFYVSVVSDIANAVNTTQQRHEDQSTIQRLMVERRDAVSGVSLDEEMADLVKFQRAFDASARVMRVIDEMLETIVNGLLR
ncbi:MAG: flagellar hook-associated protein FlgK [Verrucomicrobia bacterium]|nr:MAG: flagellar hook-associated protein FlgK [Verrucomicrobiota bacterium]